MKIRTRLTMMFIGIVTLVLSCVSFSIYFFSADYREDDFYRRLRSKAENTARLLIEVDEIDTELLKRIEKNNPSNLPNERITIYNFKNEELYNSDSGDQVHVDDQLLDRIRLEEEIRFQQDNFEVLGFLFKEKYDHFTVVAAATDTNGIGKLKNLRKVLWIVFGVSLVLVSILGWIYAGRALKPISTLVLDVSNISADNLDQRLDEGNKKDELAKLSQTFNKLLTRLEAAFLAQKNFIANASHELRTPITAMVGEIDVTLLQPRAPEKYVEVLHSVGEEIVNLNTLVNQLLLLAHASTDIPEQRFSLVRIDELVWQVKEELLRVHPEYGIQIVFDLMLNEESLAIRGDEQLIKAAFSNLMDNASKYSIDNRATVNLRLAGRFVCIEFINRGMGIVAADLQSIFDPFFRGSNTMDIKGHGIGLSLAKKIVALHKGSIKVHSTPGHVTQFIITLPIGR